jgi:uncharacterized protein
LFRVPTVNRQRRPAAVNSGFVNSTGHLSNRCLNKRTTRHRIIRFTAKIEVSKMAEQRHTGNPGNFAEDREKASRAGHIGGQHSSGNFANDPERAAEAGRKGGKRSHGGGGSQNNSGNFAQDREKASRAGQVGGQHSHEASESKASQASHQGGAEHNPGNFAEDRAKASEAGRRGGHSSHGGH